MNPKNGSTPLLVCCSTGGRDMVKLLLDNGANINCVESKQNSALMVAIMHGYQDVAMMRNPKRHRLDATEC